MGTSNTRDKLILEVFSCLWKQKLKQIFFSKQKKSAFMMLTKQGGPIRLIDLKAKDLKIHRVQQGGPIRPIDLKTKDLLYLF